MKTRMKATVHVLANSALASVALAGGILQDSYNVVAKIDGNPAQLEQTSMNLTFDGQRYYSGSGGGPSGNRIGQFDIDGNYIASYQPNLDLRSIFTMGGNSQPLFARQFADNTIYKETGPGTFAPSVTLQGSMDFQSAVAFNDNGQFFVAMSAGGLVQVWDTGGVEQTPFNLSGFGSQNNEDSYPQNIIINTGGNYFITYSEGVLSAWTAQGTRVGDTKLIDAGTSFDSHFSLSYANGLVWVIDEANGVWRGYDIPELIVGNACYPDCDADGVLTIDDFICFQTFFALGDPYADCDADTVLTIDDFICFQTFFAIGC